METGFAPLNTLDYFSYYQTFDCFNKNGVFLFALIGILGATTESLIMYLGNNPWSYKTITLFNFPIWLVFLWGLAGVIFITLYEGVMKIK